VRLVRVADGTTAAEETGASVVPCHPDRVRRNYAPELKPIDYIMAALAEHQNKCVDCGGAGCNYAAVAI
jgi:hypothetical protein